MVASLLAKGMMINAPRGPDHRATPFWHHYPSDAAHADALVTVASTAEFPTLGTLPPLR